MELDPRLLDSTLRVAFPSELRACLNSHGLYNSVQCVLRLSPEVHRRVSNMPHGLVAGDAINFEDLQAFSTYLHETVHWWQHSGSVTGLMLSLSYPAQAHANYSKLKQLLKEVGPKKSVHKWLMSADGPSGPDTTIGLGSTILNNHYDIEFFRILTSNPLLGTEAVKSGLFEAMGHSCAITYGNIALILADTIQEHENFLTDPRGWEADFDELRRSKAAGYSYGTEIKLAPVGALHLFEGQARFVQLQYLYFASGEKLTWDDVHARGMLKGVYGDAFRAFLQLTGLPQPKSIDDPSVALFMLIADIAINPGAGFPMPLRSFSTFFEDVDPGMRFLFLCRAVATKHPELATAITEYSRREYVEVSGTLCQALLIDSPVAILNRIASWFRTSSGAQALMREHASFDYRPENLAVRLLFAHFLMFSIDKFLQPEVFCWTGAWMAGERVSEAMSDTFDRHCAPFIDKADDDGVFPRLMKGRDEATVHKAFSNFYGANVSYDLTRQWIATEGPFLYEYSWLASGDSDTYRKFGSTQFERLYGVSPESFMIL